MVPIFKDKGDIQECENYKGINLNINLVFCWKIDNGAVYLRGTTCSKVWGEDEKAMYGVYILRKSLW